MQCHGEDEPTKEEEQITPVPFSRPLFSSKWSIPEIEISTQGQFEAMNGHFISDSSDRQAIAYILRMIAVSPLLKTKLQQEARLEQNSKTIIGGFKKMSGMDSE